MDTLVDILRNPSLEARELPLSLLRDITYNFSVECEIGKGGFGMVYQGFLTNGMKVAVKRLKTEGGVFNDKLFNAELHCMKKLRNKNVVRLLGYCIHTVEKQGLYDGVMYPMIVEQERLLCLEFVPHGSAQKAGPVDGEEWEKRYQIIKGVCNGLDYIHDQGFIHLDLKPDNILLDDGMVPKLADFGMTRFFDEEYTRKTIHIGGSMGYMAPEYTADGTMSQKADIYSLGTVIFDLLIGSKGPLAHQTSQEEKENFVDQALHSWNFSLITGYRGHKLETAYQQVEVCLKIALNCKDHNKYCRRTAKQISYIIDLALDPYILQPGNIQEAVFVKQFSSVEDMDFHASKPWILLSQLSGHIEIFNHQTKVSLGQFEVSKKPVHSAKFVQGKNRWNIVASDDRGVLHLLNFEEHEELGKFKTIMATGGKGITSLAVHPSKRFVLLSTGSSIMIWNTDDWTCTRMHHGTSYFKIVSHASFNTNDDREFGIGCCDGTVKLWSHASLTSTRRPYLVLRDHSDQVCSIDYFTRNSETFVVTGSIDKTAKVWKYDDKTVAAGLQLASITKPEATLKHVNGVTATCYVPKLNVILTGTNKGLVSVWCAQNYSRKRFLCFGLGRIHSLSCLTGTRVFIGHEHGLVLVDIDPKKL